MSCKVPQTEVHSLDLCTIRWIDSEHSVECAWWFVVGYQLPVLIVLIIWVSQLPSAYWLLLWYVEGLGQAVLKNTRVFGLQPGKASPMRQNNKKTPELNWPLLQRKTGRATSPLLQSPYEFTMPCMLAPVWLRILLFEGGMRFSISLLRWNSFWKYNAPAWPHRLLSLFWGGQPKLQQL